MISKKMIMAVVALSLFSLCAFSMENKKKISQMEKYGVDEKDAKRIRMAILGIPNRFEEIGISNEQEVVKKYLAIKNLSDSEIGANVKELLEIDKESIRLYREKLSNEESKKANFRGSLCGAILQKDMKQFKYFMDSYNDDPNIEIRLINAKCGIDDLAKKKLKFDKVKKDILEEILFDFAERSSNLKEVAFLVEQVGMDVNYERLDKKGDKELLIQHAFDVNILFDENNLEIIKYLLQKGANVNKRKFSHYDKKELKWIEESVISIACESGNLDLVKVLVQFGKDVKINECDFELAKKNTHQGVREYFEEVFKKQQENKNEKQDKMEID